MYGTRWGQLLGNRTAVAGGPASLQAWDPGVTVGPLVLSAHDTVVTVEAPGADVGDGTYGVLSQSGGQVYWEIVFFNDTGGSDGNPLNCGLIDSGGAIGAVDEHVVIAATDGGVYGNSGTLGGWVPPAQGDIICLYADLDIREFFVKRGGDDWSGMSGTGDDPAAMTGFDISYLGADVFPYLDIHMNTGGSAVAKFSPSQWVYSPPATASAWVGGGAPPAAVSEFDDEKTTANVVLSGTPALVATAGTTVSGDGSAGADSLFHETGQYYWEMELTIHAGGGSNTGSGIISATFTMGTDGYLGGDALALAYYTDGFMYCEGEAAGTGSTLGTGDVVGHILNLDANTLQFTKNGGASGTPLDITSVNVAGGVGPAIDFETGEAGSVWTANFGTEGYFKYLAPTGYLRLDGTDPLRQVWDPAHSATATLSADYLTATSTAGEGNNFGLLNRTSGKIAWKVTITGGADFGVGITNTYSIGGSLMGGSTNDIVYFSDGNVYKNSIALAAIGGLTTGDDAWCAINLDVSPRRMWFKKNSGNWKGPGGDADPGTPSSGFDISSITGAVWPATDSRSIGIVMAGDFLDETEWPAGYGGWV